MEENAVGLVFAIIWIILIIYEIIQNRKRYEKVDGVESIDGITYLIKDTDVSYIMYKLNSTCISKNIKDKEFETVNEKEGILTFGGINYSLSSRGYDMNIGRAYRIKCEQQDHDVIMKISLEKGASAWWREPSRESTEFLMNQAYHRFFKEIFDVQVVK